MPKTIELLEYPEHINDVTPLQLAIKLKHEGCVKILSNTISGDHLDKNGSSIYHYAANSTSKIIHNLKKQTIKHMNHRNNKGFTPLQIACSMNNLDCINALICAGADVTLDDSVVEFLRENEECLIAQDMSQGGTPLHFAVSREAIETLLKHGCCINSRDGKNRTALHLMAAENRLECVIVLLTEGAEMDFRDKYGLTPLEVAISKRHILT